jgi:hypothetical protein
MADKNRDSRHCNADAGRGGMAEQDDKEGAGKGSERRIAARRKVSLPADVDLGESGGMESCWLRDISDTGAKLEFEGGKQVPPHFTLQVGDEIYTCEKVWQGPSFTGVQFEANEYVRELLGRIRELFEEADGNVGAIVSLSQAARIGAFGTLNLPGLTTQLDRIAADGRALISSMDELVREFGDERLSVLADSDDGNDTGEPG